ncbi:FG-GAP-like repeat-containing protein [Chloroflexota bacterium]
MKIVSRWLISLAIALLAMVLVTPVAYAVPPIPHSFYGTLKINEQDALAGTVVTAKFGAGLTCGPYTTTEAGKYGDNATASYLAVTHDNIHEGDPVSFYVNGIDTGETALFVPGGGPTELNLTAELTIASRTPAANALDVVRTSNIVVQFNASINGTSVSENTFNVDGSLSGEIAGAYSTVTDTVTFNPASNFKAGETVTVTLTTGIEDEYGVKLVSSLTWQFVVDAPQGYASFEDTGQTLGTTYSQGAELGDFDGDGDLDAFVANIAGQGNKVWLNNGSANFTDSSQSLGSYYSYDVALGDVDSDGDLDAFVANYSGAANRVWLNNGSGTFSTNGQSLGTSDSHGVALGDIDGDGDIDAFIANFTSQGNTVWYNDGSGNFTDSEQSLGTATSNDVALGDVDGDGDLDAFMANNSANKVWLNDGSGNFTDSEQAIGSSDSTDIALNDLDGDGDLDAFVTNTFFSGDRVWLNNGSGTFITNGQSLETTYSQGVRLGDLDSDGDLDAFVTVSSASAEPNLVWLNDGSANFTDSGQLLGSSKSYCPALGDLDGDGDLDAFVANTLNLPDEVWLNEPTLVAETSISEELDQATGKIVVVNVNIDRIKDPSDNSTANITGGIGSYSAIVSSAPGSGIEVLGVTGLAPFADLTFDNVTGIFSAANVTSPSPIQADNTTVAELVLRLSGNATTPYDLTVAFQSIGDAAESGLNVPEEQDNTFTFQRGDPSGDGKVSMVDAMFAAQVYVKVKPMDEIHAVNAASVIYDTGGDKISMTDAMAMAQYYVKLRDADFNLK